MTSPLLIFSDSDALIGDIRWVFRDRLECISSDSMDWIEKYIKYHDIKLFIADMDILNKDENLRAQVLDGLRDYQNDRIAFLFLVSEKMKLEIERDYNGLYGMLLTSDWLIKPFSRDALVSSVEKLCG